ncbi:MAG: lactococcin 972 family bacteriocin [Rhodoglobus sp.]
MNRTKKFALGSLLILPLVLSSGLAANATVEYPEGGTWSYGYTYLGPDNYNLYSNYHHSSRTHRSTVCKVSPTTNCTYSSWATAGLYSYAGTSWNGWSNPSYYYSFT